MKVYENVGDEGGGVRTEQTNAYFVQEFVMLQFRGPFPFNRVSSPHVFSVQ